LKEIFHQHFGNVTSFSEWLSTSDKEDSFDMTFQGWVPGHRPIPDLSGGRRDRTPTTHHCSAATWPTEEKV